MPLFPFRVNIFKLQEQDVMKKFTACTFPQDIIASSRWSAIHAQIHTCTDTSRIDRGTTDWLRCSPKHVRSLVWKRKRKKKKIKKIKKRNESISQPAEKGRQTLLSSACTAGATWFIPWDSWKLKSSLFKLVPWQKWSNCLMSQITLTSKAPPSHLAFLALRIQRTNIILFHVCLWGCRAQCGYLHKELQNQAKLLVSVMPLSYCFTFILFST